MVAEMVGHLPRLETRQERHPGCPDWFPFEQATECRIQTPRIDWEVDVRSILLHILLGALV